MSERHKDEFNRVGLVIVGFIIAFVCVVALALVAYFEVNSPIQLQRRVSDLEQKK